LLSIVAGTWAAAQAMFLHEEDLGALAVILVAATVVATGSAILIGARVGRAVDALIVLTRRLGDGTTDFVVVPESVPQELTRLHAELARSSARLAEARQRERALDASRRELVAWVSHDLRTPLAGLRALAEALEDRIIDDPKTIARYHTTLRVESERLSGLVDDLFELSRTQAGVLQLEFDKVSLADLVSDALAGATVAAEAKGVRLEGRLAGPPPQLRAAAPEVLRVLRNILENAIRHTPGDGAVIVEAGTECDLAYVRVRDSGGGIPELDLPRVFDVAFRGDSARTPGDGAGLGLAIARGLVEAHDGEITVHNEHGGACFTVLLPLVQPTDFADDASEVEAC
jgi:signal transduction histidine kinase